MQKKDVSEVVLAAIHELSKSLEEGIHAVNELKELLPLTQSELNAWIKDTINTEGEESRRVDLVIAMSNNWRQIIHGIKESEEIIDNWIRRIEKDPFDISWDINDRSSHDKWCLCRDCRDLADDYRAMFDKLIDIVHYLEEKKSNKQVKSAFDFKGKEEFIEFCSKLNWNKRVEVQPLSSHPSVTQE